VRISQRFNFTSYSIYYPMNSSNILEGSWEAYNNRKISNGQDPNFFVPEDVWELNYLVDMILASRPHLDHLTVMLSVREGMRRTMAPRARQHFIELVMTNLKNRENQWLQLVKSISNERSEVSDADEYPFSFN
jgi:hypothetical protein